MSKGTRKVVTIADALKVQNFLRSQAGPMSVEEIAKDMAEVAGLSEDYKNRESSYNQGIRRECERLADANLADKVRQGRKVVYSILNPEQAEIKAKEQAEIKAKQAKISEGLQAMGFTTEEQQDIMDQRAIRMSLDQFIHVLDN